jgi:hypothetical protein
MPVTSFPVYIPVGSLGGWGTFARPYLLHGIALTG